MHGYRFQLEYLRNLLGHSNFGRNSFLNGINPYSDNTMCVWPYYSTRPSFPGSTLENRFLGLSNFEYILDWEYSIKFLTEPVPIISYIVLLPNIFSKICGKMFLEDFVLTET